MNLLIIDDLKIVREGIVSLLQDYPDIEEIHTADNGIRALQEFQNRSIDLIILEINLPGINGIDYTAEIRKQYKNVKILALTRINEENHIRNMIEAGANGYILKRSGKKELFDAINMVMKGEYYFSNEIKTIVMHDLLPYKKDRFRTLQLTKIPLTVRELEILNLIVNELTNPEIAKKLHISERTVDSHRRNLLKKTNARNTAGLVKYAFVHNLIDENILY